MTPWSDVTQPSACSIESAPTSHLLHMLKSKLLIIIFCTISSCVSHAFEIAPEWATIGNDEIVLPRFEPLRWDGSALRLSAERQYVWKSSPLPDQLRARGREYVVAQGLELFIDGRQINLDDMPLTTPAVTGHHVEVTRRQLTKNGIEITVTSRVEYDGVAMVTLSIVPSSAHVLNSLTYRAKIKRNEWTRLLAFRPETISRRLKKTVFEPRYSGPFLNALGVVDGSHGFWFFVDHTRNWSPARPPTSVVSEKDYVIVQQPLVSEPIPLVDALHYNLNFLVSPVTEQIHNRRADRFCRRPNATEAKYCGVSHWWIDAFIHQTLPYVRPENTFASALSPYNRRAYKGVEHNRQEIRRYARLGIDRIPYFSAHVLHHADPAYRAHKEEWERHPRIDWSHMRYDGPFRGKRKTTFLSHLSQDYSHYLLWRMSELVDELGFEGLYFDQGMIYESKNPRHGAWKDVRGKPRGTTEILAIRSFFKRLATMLHLEGKKGRILVHNSNAPILPAYTFVTQMVQGEEFVHTLRDLDYIASTNLAEIRTRYGSSHFGVGSMWQEVLYAPSKRLKLSERDSTLTKEQWLASNRYARAFRKYLTLVLLHDLSTWNYAPVDLKEDIYSKLQWLEDAPFEFHGYWEQPMASFASGLFLSYYDAKSRDKMIFILANLSSEDARVGRRRVLAKAEEYGADTCAKWNLHYEDARALGAPIRTGDFRLIRIWCAAEG